jgi:hypothetical protein
LLELLADQATQGLATGEQAELNLRRKQFPDLDDTALEVATLPPGWHGRVGGRRGILRQIHDGLGVLLDEVRGRHG